MGMKESSQKKNFSGTFFRRNFRPENYFLIFLVTKKLDCDEFNLSLIIFKKALIQQNEPSGETWCIRPGFKSLLVKSPQYWEEKEKCAGIRTQPLMHKTHNKLKWSIKSRIKNYELAVHYQQPTSNSRPYSRNGKTLVNLPATSFLMVDIFIWPILCFLSLLCLKLHF